MKVRTAASGPRSSELTTITVNLGHSKWLAVLRGKQQRALAQLKLLDEAGFNVGPSRAIKESAISSFTPVHSVRRKAPEANLIPDLVILVSTFQLALSSEK